MSKWIFDGDGRLVDLDKAYCIEAIQEHPTDKFVKVIAKFQNGAPALFAVLDGNDMWNNAQEKVHELKRFITEFQK